MKLRNSMFLLGISIALTGAVATGCEEAPAPGTGAAGTAAAKATVEGAATDTAATPRELTVEEVSTLLASGAITVCDANSDSTRNEYGVIPGAKLLSSSGKFDPASELPGDKATKLVFYCSSTSCSAAEGAAGKAIIAGYNDVNVMRAGIKGWKEAGKPTATPTPM